MNQPAVKELVVIRFIGGVTGVTTFEGWLRTCGQTLQFNELTRGAVTTAAQAWETVVSGRKGNPVSIPGSPSLPIALFGPDRADRLNGNLHDMEDLLALSDAHVERHELDILYEFWPKATNEELAGMFGAHIVDSVLAVANTSAVSSS